MENLVNFAVNYAKHGFSVIPISHTEKRPLIKFANKPALTPDEIRELWKRYPLANIALKTENFFVIDVDRHGEVDGMDSIVKLKHNEWFQNTLCERTAHDGYHFYFQKPADKTITQNIGFLPGVDLKAHENNYVVVAPSSIDGKHYKWLNHKPIATAPKELLELIKEKSKSLKPYGKDKMASYSVSGKNQTSELFETIVNGFGETGGRNNACAAFMGGLLYRNVDPEIAVELAKIANSHTKDKLSEAEVETTANSMIEKEIRRRNA